MSFRKNILQTAPFQTQDEERELCIFQTAKATKAKASTAQQQQQQSPPKGNGDLVRLEKAYRSCHGELAKMQKHLQQMQEIKTSWDVMTFCSQSFKPNPLPL